jgi:phosphopantetheine--protein transferase-like protein
VTESSAKAFSASSHRLSSLRQVLPALGVQDVHLWLCSRDRFSCSDAFKRNVLARYIGVAPSDLDFEVNEHGKPSLAGESFDLDFNLSHSGDWLACAVTAGTPVGVDLELCNPDRVSLKVARRFFRGEEATVLESYSGAQQADRFYDFWTLKEAAVKARGEALAPGLVSHGFELCLPADAGGADGHITATAPDAPETTHYCLLSPLPGYRLAICWRSEMRLLPQLNVFELGEKDAVAELALPLRASSRPA